MFQVAYGISSGIINSGLATHPTFTEHPLHPHTHCHIRLTRALLAQPARDLGPRWEERGHMRPQTRRLSTEQKNCMATVSPKYFSFPPKDINFIICLFDCKSRCICTQSKQNMGTLGPWQRTKNSVALLKPNAWLKGLGLQRKMGRRLVPLSQWVPHFEKHFPESVKKFKNASP